MSEFRICWSAISNVSCICWSASSNVSFNGATSWREWDPEDGDMDDALSNGMLTIEGLEMALDACGFDWWIEEREADS